MTWNTALLILWENIELSTHMFNNMFTQPTTNVPQQLIKKMCDDTATFLEQQAGREYGFGKGVYAAV